MNLWAIRHSTYNGSEGLMNVKFNAMIPNFGDKYCRQEDRNF
jgi:hypothetical protein